MEKPKFNNLVVTETQSGKFYKCMFNGIKISEKELFERILKTKKESGFRLSHYIDAFAKTNRNFNVLMQEQDVS